MTPPAPSRARSRSRRPPLLLRLGLRMAGWLRRPMELLGADPKAYEAIVSVKLALDFRRKSFGFAAAESSRGITMALLNNLLVGAVVGLWGAFIDHPMTYMIVAQSAIMVMLSLALLVDYTQVLLDTGDLTIVAPRPVGDRTVMAARIAHVLVYLTFNLVATMAVPLVVGCFKFPHPLFPPLFLASGLLTTGLVLFLVTVLYMGIFRLFPRERVLDVISYVQVGALVTIFLGYQIVPRLVAPDGGPAAGEPLWLLAVPPAWFGGLITAAFGDATPLRLWLAGLAVGAPLLLTVVAVRLASSRLMSQLTELSETGGRSRRRARPRAMNAVGRLVTRPGHERAGFDFALHLARRERRFRLAVLPSVFLPFLYLVGLRLVFDDVIGGRPWMVMFCGYFFALSSVGAIVQARYSESHEAAWLFDALPLGDRAPFLSGAVRGVLVGYVGPPALLLAGTLVLVLGTASLADVLLMLWFVPLFGLVVLYFVGWTLPFTSAFSPARSGTQTSAMLASLFLGGGMVVLHVLIAPYRGAVWVAQAAVFLAVLQLFDRVPRAVARRGSRRALRGSSPRESATESGGVGATGDRRREAGGPHC